MKQRVNNKPKLLDKQFGQVESTRELPGESRNEKKPELPWDALPTGVTDAIVLFLGCPDMCAHIRMVSTGLGNWISEFVVQQLCMRIFAAQTQRNKLKIENWKSWSNLLVYKPRLRTNGFYTLRTLFSKAPCNDRFWEDRNYQSIEVHYRFKLQSC